MANVNRWRFSLRALLIFSLVVAAVTAFAASYPWVALLIFLGTIYVLFESGAIFDFIRYLAKPHVFARHPLLATVAWIVVGVSSFAVAGFLVFFLFSVKNLSVMFEAVPAAILICLFCGAGGFCFWLLWKSFKSDATEPAGTGNEPPAKD